MSHGRKYSPVTGWGFEHRVRKPAGGFCFISASAMLKAWEAYRSKQIHLVDLRVWFACFELVARRCGLQTGRGADYRIEELGALIGGAAANRIGPSVRRLEGAGLLCWRSTEVDLTPAGTGDLTNLDGANSQRPIPVPRRLLRFIAAGTSRALLATVLGHLLKCLWYRNGTCISGGHCKAGWIARLFGVDLRNVKAARKKLMEMGWLEAVSVGQRALNRWGMAVIWRMGFHVKHIESPPLVGKACIESPPPVQEKKLSSREQSRTGVWSNGEQQMSAQRNRTVQRGMPTLRDVQGADLSDYRRLGCLFEQATKRGWVNGSECDRLRVFGAAEHARTCGRNNPPGLFIWLIKNQRWDFITQRDEDAARQRLRQRPATAARDRSKATPLAMPSPIASVCITVLSKLGHEQASGWAGPAESPPRFTTASAGAALAA